MTPPTPDDAFLFDVDTQRDFQDPAGALYVPGAEGLEDAYRALLAVAAARSVPVVASADAHPPDDPEFVDFPPHCLRGSPGAERIDATRPARPVLVAPGGEGARVPGVGETLVLQKVAFDPFTNPAAGPLVAGLGRRAAVVFGVALDYCVRAAALGLRERGLDVYLVRDATAPVTPETGAAALAELVEAGVRPLSTAALLEAWGAG